MDVWMRLPDERGRISHVECRAAEVQVVNGPRIRGLHVRLVDTGDRQFLTALEAADWGGLRRRRARRGMKCGRCWTRWTRTCAEPRVPWSVASHAWAWQASWGGRGGLQFPGG
jgi:hypothetical protein